MYERRIIAGVRILIVSSICGENITIYTRVKAPVTVKWGPITKYKQQLGKRLFVFATSRPYSYHAALRNRRPISSHASSKMPPICKSDVLLSAFHWH